MPSIPEQLAELEKLKLKRQLIELNSPQSTTIDCAAGPLINFASNDYLGLSQEPELIAAHQAATRQWGVGSGSSRLITGSLRPHHQLEEQLASIKQTQAALTFTSGFATAIGTLPALVGPRDLILVDKLAHASLIDGIKLSRAKFRSFRHNDLDHLSSLLQNAQAKRQPNQRLLIVTESVFSMDGDHAPLREIVALKAAYDAWLLLDEAHGFGCFGNNGAGLAHQLGVHQQIDIHLGTLSKAVGLAGGFIAADRQVIDLLINRARSFIYSTAPPPAIAHTAQRALDLITGPLGTKRRHQLDQLRQLAAQLLNCPAASAIIPILLGSSETAIAASQSLRNQGLLIPAIRYPTVPQNSARLRLTLNANHTLPQVKNAAQAINQFLSTT